VRKLATWLLVTLGIAALVRKLRRRSEPAQPTPVLQPTAPETAPAAAATTTEAKAESESEDPADELRRKLAETRTDDEPATPAPAEASVEERRAEVYEQGRSTLDEMQPPGEG